MEETPGRASLEKLGVCIITILFQFFVVSGSGTSPFDQREAEDESGTVGGDWGGQVSNKTFFCICSVT